MKWEDRMVQLRKYKENHGHLRIPVTDPELGEFVGRTRVEYTKYLEGNMNVGMTNEARAKELANLGFLFSVGKRVPVEQRSKSRKTWEERYEDLKNFKSQFGHMLVPQQTGLGEWVHKQRRFYKLVAAGKPCPMTTERVVKLNNIGFIFDASGYRRTKKIGEEPIAQDPVGQVDGTLWIENEIQR